MPNITGSFVLFQIAEKAAYLSQKQGAVKDSYIDGLEAAFGKTNTEQGDFIFDFKASNSNIVYGSSTTVQPTTARLTLAVYLGNAVII